MRVIHMHENKQRGCVYCNDVVKRKHGYVTQTSCPHDECPYKVLDKYESYEDFMASEDSRILVEEFFDSVAECYSLSSSSKKPVRNSSDGDFRIGL